MNRGFPTNSVMLHC
ncbi:hypothetical protein LEMLEM_LOCUS21446 [Lemmus lemmus]